MTEWSWQPIRLRLLRLHFALPLDQFGIRNFAGRVTRRGPPRGQKGPQDCNAEPGGHAEAIREFVEAWQGACFRPFRVADDGRRGLHIAPGLLHTAPRDVSDPSPNPPTPHGDGSFATTRWSLVRRAAGAGAERALDELCGIYWYPLYCYARRRGSQADDAQDLVQGFFQKLLANSLFARADQTKGKLRGFLLTAFQGYISDVRKHSHAAKRGGGREMIPLDTTDAEARYAGEPTDLESPDKLYARRWALTVLRRAVDALQAVWMQEGKGQLFAALNPYLLAPLDGESRRRVAEALGMSEDNVKVSLSRLRDRYRKALWDEIAETVTSEAEVEEEMAALRAAVS